ncbi:hypothetical protein OIU84_001855 [Salix udensis]|uniref:Uncharacterized protein n=1 Tax=Salix udensis TaxID=889485 RepID=A0AAD6P6I1_9ROSI|nr:hypothetical protein OIU84_001855 [Salix udensis]
MQSRRFIYFACYCSDYLDKDHCTSFSFLFLIHVSSDLLSPLIVRCLQLKQGKSVVLLPPDCFNLKADR